jgi:pimeloyl-ACP methyl ester carboxylesterase
MLWAVPSRATSAKTTGVERGTLGRLPYAALGAGPPLVLLAGLSPTAGVAGDGLLRGIAGPFLGAGRRLIVFNRRPGLPPGMTMAELAAEHAAALRELGAPVDVAGVSTGGSIAQQLAADHPHAVGRLVLAGTACRLGPAGKALQRRVAARIRAGARRRALAVGAAALVPRSQVLAGAAGWLLGPLLVRGDLDDMATTIEAEDTFDLASCPAIRAPTLILAGRDDRFYPPELFEETARLIPGAKLHVLDGRGHVTALNDPRFRGALSSFLA